MKIIDTIVSHLNGAKIDYSLNPWAGLASYEDPMIAERKLKFCGRDDDSYDLARLIMGNVFVTLYGKSGIGKTSLLNAGVFPELREEQYCPVSIRLGMSEEEHSLSYQTMIIRAVECVVKRIETIKVIDEQKDQQSTDYLWNYFARHRFYDKNNEPTTPVIVFDQFEEVFRGHRDEAETLLRQLDYLNDKDHTLDSWEADGLSFKYEKNYRFVVSIREDDLYRLEDSIDNCYLPALKRCRYRLRNLSKQGARDAIIIPGKDLFNPREIEQIVGTIIAVALGDDDSVNSNILSLLCSRIYVEKKNSLLHDETVNHEFVERLMSSNPLEQFYIEATRSLSDKEKAYLEKNLVDDTGRRGNVAKESFDKIIKDGERLLDGVTKILQVSNGRVELIHDSFCPVIEKLKMQRKERWLNIIDYLFLALVSLVIVLFMAYSPICFDLIYDLASINGITTKWDISFVFQIGSIICIFITLGILHKLYSPILSIIGLSISSIPVTLYSVLYYYSFLHHKTTEIYSLPLLFILCSLVLIVISILPFANKKKEVIMSKSDMFASQQCRTWLTILLGSYLYIVLFGTTIYDSTSDLGSVSFIWIIFIALFCSLLKDAWFSILIPVFLLPIIFIVFLTSDITPYALVIKSYMPILPYLLVIAPFFYLAISVVRESEKEEKKVAIIVFSFMAVLYFGASFIFYRLFYQYKFLMLIIYLSFWLWFLGIILLENKRPIKTCIIIFVFIIGAYTFFLGYNPLLKGVDPTLQEGNWRWRTILMESNNKYKILDVWRGEKVFDIDFDDFKNKHLLLETKYRFKTINNNKFISSIINTSTVKYYYDPGNEYKLSKEKARGSLWAIIYCDYRNLILSHIISGNIIMSNQYSPIISQLINEEIIAIKKHLQENHIEANGDLTMLLCRALSTSLMQSASVEINRMSSEKMEQLINAFDKFAYTHIINEKHQDNKNIDWDGFFETIVQQYFAINNAGIKDHYLEYILPSMINKYETTPNYGLKTYLYGKIYRLNQLSKRNGMEDYLKDVKSIYD